ncbi:MAG: hypothetical protein WCI05_01750 [Myxococcales bacterium]
MSQTKKPLHPVVVLNLATDVAGLLVQTRNVIERMGDDDGKKWFPNAASALSVLAPTLLNRRILLRRAMPSVRPPSVTWRSPSWRRLIARAAAMSLLTRTPRKKRGHEAKPGSVSGTVHYTIPSFGRKAAVIYQASSDGGKTWPVQIMSDQGVVDFENLTVGILWSFRHQVTLKGKSGDWSQIADRVRSCSF